MPAAGAAHSPARRVTLGVERLNERLYTCRSAFLAVDRHHRAGPRQCGCGFDRGGTQDHPATTKSTTVILTAIKGVAVDPRGRRRWHVRDRAFRISNLVPLPHLLEANVASLRVDARAAGGPMLVAISASPSTTGGSVPSALRRADVAPALSDVPAPVVPPTVLRVRCNAVRCTVASSRRAAPALHHQFEQQSARAVFLKLGAQAKAMFGLDGSAIRRHWSHRLAPAIRWPSTR